VDIDERRIGVRQQTLDRRPVRHLMCLHVKSVANALSAREWKVDICGVDVADSRD
jgi:hypothetical protein